MRAIGWVGENISDERRARAGSTWTLEHYYYYYAPALAKKTGFRALRKYKSDAPDAMLIRSCDDDDDDDDDDDRHVGTP